MKALFINAVCGIRSTGRICIDLAQELETQGYEVKIAYSRETVPEQYQKYAVRIGNTLDVYWHALMTRLFDDRGYWSRIATKRFLKWADKYNPDLLWLHNIHDYVINIDMLFDWIKSRPNMQVKWTQHDCWAFTGGCMHYITQNCNQWKTLCVSCPKAYRQSLLPLMHKEKKVFEKKKELFSGSSNLEIIVPSYWMKEQVEKSFLNRYNIIVSNNNIDLTVFRPVDSLFRSNYKLNDKFIILGVASAWSKNKGLEDFYSLSKITDHDKYQIVLVGLSKKQAIKLPKGIIGINRTNNQSQLAEIYSSANVFFNPTYADTYPTVNLEAEACGTRVITYNTGGAPETIHRKDSVVIPQGKYWLLLKLLK